MVMQQSLFGSLINQEASATCLADVNQPIDSTVFTVIDVETTGLNPKKNDLLEVTAIKYEQGKDMSIYTSMVQPTTPIPPEVEELTGINQAMVAQAPPQITVLTELCQFVGASPVIVGHNISFDIAFINEKLESVGLGSMVSRFDLKTALCTKVLAQKILPGLPSYQGIVVATQCGVRNDNPHRAEADVRMSAGILFALIEKLRGEGKDATTLNDLLTIQGDLG